MKRLYTFLRLGGYLAGTGGAVLLLYGRRQAWEARPPWLAAGGALLAAMFALFFASYVLWFLDRMRSRTRPPARALFDRRDDAPPEPPP